ncbi:MAG: hypothetical protein R2830_15685 [Saprospiraceae bacterium]
MKLTLSGFLHGLALVIICLFHFQCKDEAIDIDDEECVVSELIKYYYIMGDTIIDTISHVIENEYIVERLRNGNFYEEFEYNENGQLVVGLNYYYPTMNWYIRDSFFYENEKLIKRVSYSPDGMVITNQDFLWEGDSLMSGYGISFQNENGEWKKYDTKFEYEYTGNNITETIRTLYTASGDTLFLREEFQFDLNENYTNNFTVIPQKFISDFSLWNAPYWFSENNVLLETRYHSVDQWTGEKSFVYTWENGKASEIVSSSLSNTSSDTVVGRTKINYDCW